MPIFVGRTVIPEPFNVKYWAIGNEEEASDYVGLHQDPKKYVETAWQIVKLMKLTDPSIKIVLCGGSDAWNKNCARRNEQSVRLFFNAHLY